LIPNIRDWPIHKLYEDREGLVATVDKLTLDHIIEKHGDRIGGPDFKSLLSRIDTTEGNPMESRSAE
jgi:hypothetical protein